MHVDGSGMTTLVQAATRTAAADAQSDDQQGHYRDDDADDEVGTTKSIETLIQ